ncbi:sigma-70 family RNA polymerase sigma factor [Romboutsia weinsteinii]|uniref:Sigma-70 family RNA polymerase sigma factor n=1 Tax=Romboutsia weinsteinii TaxID=2020949 RepID=A0A371IYL8_9FIRM|nr:sigma-70 family RNA polymerase sigma factor [Romboutsia weinsteinii]RDY25575.1 sigma-70 family RNA polymerase sigma factor [Romboutsia weinsteinii]
MKINEKNFIKFLKKKNEKALDYVVDTYGGLIKSIVNKHLYNLKDYNEECIHDIFLAVWYGVDQYDTEKGDFKNWIAAIAKYKCISYKRKYLEEYSIQDLESIEITADNIEIEIEQQELKKEVDNLLDSLKPEDKKIFIEYYIEGKTIKEISSSMNIKDENIYNRISRGKKKLRMLFGNK